MSEITGTNNTKYKPYDGTGIEEGDVIVEIDDKEVKSTDELTSAINKSKGNNVEVTYIRNGETLTTTIIPIRTIDNSYKIGLWVRDAAAGVGTATFYNPKTKEFAALGHGIVDSDTDQIIDIASGEVVTANILSIVKGKDGTPGRIQGTIDGEPTIGKITKNTVYGIYGNLTNIGALLINNKNVKPIALREEIEARRCNSHFYTAKSVKRRSIK